MAKGFKWQYYTLRVSNRSAIFAEEAKALAEAGNEGWELVSTRNEPAYNVYYFKRLVVDPEAT